MAEHSAAVTIVSFIEPFIILQCLNTAVSLQVTFTSHSNPIQVEFLEGVVVSNHIWDCPLEGETHTHTQYIWFDQQLNKHTPPHKAVDTLAAWVHKSDLINANSQIGFWKLISGTKKGDKNKQKRAQMREAGRWTGRESWSAVNGTVRLCERWIYTRWKQRD